MGLVAYVNGEFVPKEEARVSALDHGFLYGDGVFEGIRVYNGRIFRLEQHIDRLYESAQTIMLEIPLSKEEMKQAIVETVRRNGLRDAYIRPIVSRGVGDLGLDPRKCGRPTVVIIVDHIQLYPKEAYEKGLRTITASTRKIPPHCLNPRVKSLNYLGNIMARIEANLAGVEEAIMLTIDGYVAECSADNIFIAKDGTVITPPPHLGILKGVTRDAVLELCGKLDIPAFERVFTLHDVYTADECFLTGTGAEIAPVVVVDGRRIGDGKPGPITNRLLAGFRELTSREGTPVFEEEVPSKAG
ncbi:MAG: branched-chain-amino-acid transaminase [Armatimonadota bacterium]|nr:branched-chain-amino-acid transaminase [Armatimonadota bacterium]MDR5703119.1 branched-chain-amino-acid transaminase [Armatimonadota bacterium]